MERCPDCGSPIQGSQVCERCGAFDFEGLTSWVCFPCGAQNAHGQARCSCGRERSVECAACGGEVAFAAETCPHCGVPRFAFVAVAEARGRSEEVERRRGWARAFAIALAPIALCGLAMLLWAARPLGRIAGGALLGLSIAGEGYALATRRQVRRTLE